MCGRFTNRLTWREIVSLYRLSVPATPERNLPARYNICPTDTIDTVVEEDGKRDLVPMRWGLVPWWWKKRAKDVPATFNARAETVSEKPMFRDAFKRRRCLIPASGYYEAGMRQRLRLKRPKTSASQKRFGSALNVGTSFASSSTTTVRPPTHRHQVAAVLLDHRVYRVGRADVVASGRLRSGVAGTDRR